MSKHLCDIVNLNVVAEKKFIFVPLLTTGDSNVSETQTQIPTPIPFKPCKLLRSNLIIYISGVCNKLNIISRKCSLQSQYGNCSKTVID